LENMNALFVALGVVDILAGGVLFAEPASAVKILAAMMLTKGAITVVRALEHY